MLKLVNIGGSCTACGFVQLAVVVAGVVRADVSFVAKAIREKCVTAAHSYINATFEASPKWCHKHPPVCSCLSKV